MASAQSPPMSGTTGARPCEESTFPRGLRTAQRKVSLQARLDLDRPLWGHHVQHRRLNGRLRAALQRAPVEADDAPGPAFPQFDLHRDTNLAPQRTRQQPVGARARPSAMPLRTAGSFASPIGSAPSCFARRLLAARHTPGRGHLAIGALDGWHWGELACHAAPVPPNGAVGFHDRAVWMKPVADGELPQGSADRMRAR